MTKFQNNGNFINKLGFIINQQEYSQIISFDTPTKSIHIKSIHEMEKKILPFYFRHQRYISFVRQLNCYGFKKVKANGKQMFTHSRLHKGQDLESIKSIEQYHKEKRRLLKMNQQRNIQNENNININNQVLIIQQNNETQDKHLKTNLQTIRLNFQNKQKMTNYSQENSLSFSMTPLNYWNMTYQPYQMTYMYYPYTDSLYGFSLY